MTITEAVKRAHDTSRAHGFYDGHVLPYDPTFVLSRLMLIVTEAAEAAEEVRSEGWPLPVPLDAFAEELADICIRVFDMAGSLNIDLEGAIAAKMDRNDKRPYKHGKRA